jgi:EAL domain-containing protein (putative c-di-GMP-specific phosphodiesterase class I)
MQRSVEEQQVLATALHNAIKTGEISSMEALLRWNHREF